MVDRQHVRMRKIMKEISCRSIPSYGHPIGNLFSYEFGMTDRRKIPNLGAFSLDSYIFCCAQVEECFYIMPLTAHKLLSSFLSFLPSRARAKESKRRKEEKITAVLD